MSNVEPTEGYVGEHRGATGHILNFRRYGTMLAGKGRSLDTVIQGRSEIRFQPGPDFIEFQLGSAGKAAGLNCERGRQKVPASRIARRRHFE